MTSEWRKRGATESEQYRLLTNQLMHSAFGMDVEGYRRYKSLFAANHKLRDYMSDLELALTSLGETAAVALHQSRDSHGLDQLERDAREAGEIVAQTRQQIERRSGHPVIRGLSHRTDQPQQERMDHSPAKSELAERAEDMHNPSTCASLRTIA